MKKILEKIKYIYGLYRYRKLLLNLPSKHILDQDHILFNAVRQNENQLHLEYFMAYMLAKRGHKCIVLIDDGVLSHWDSVHLSETPKKKLTPMSGNIFKKYYTKFTSYMVRITYTHQNITTIRYSDLLSNTNTQHVKHEMLKYENHVISSCKRHSSDPKFHKDIRQKDYYKSSMQNALLITEVANKVLLNYNIKKLITSHGIYTTWGVFHDIFKESGINSDIYGLFIYQHKSIFLSKEPEQQLSKNKSWHIASKKSLSNRNIKKVDTFFQNRIKYMGEDSKYYFLDKNLNNRKIVRGDGEFVFGMFPNVVWDGDIKDWNINYSGVLDWVISTAKLFEGSKHKLVIRFHPSEKTLNHWADSLEDLVINEFPNIKKMKNVILMSAAYELDIYNFIKNEIDIGLIYDGILGLEMTYMGIPNISCAEGRYGDVNFSIEPKTKNSYEDLINDPIKTIEVFNNNLNERKERLYKFTHWYVEESIYELPIVDGKSFYNVDISNLQRNDIDERYNFQLKETLNKLES
jgi:hypothetical protein